MQLLKYILAIVVIALAIDFLAFLAWAISGQHPQNINSWNYAGTITTHLIRAII